MPIIRPSLHQDICHKQKQLEEMKAWKVPVGKRIAAIEIVEWRKVTIPPRHCSDGLSWGLLCPYTCLLVITSASQSGKSLLMSAETWVLASRQGRGMLSLKADISSKAAYGMHGECRMQFAARFLGDKQELAARLAPSCPILNTL